VLHLEESEGVESHAVSQPEVVDNLLPQIRRQLRRLIKSPRPRPPEICRNSNKEELLAWYRFWDSKKQGNLNVPTLTLAVVTTFHTALAKTADAQTKDAIAHAFLTELGLRESDTVTESQFIEKMAPQLVANLPVAIERGHPSGSLDPKLPLTLHLRDIKTGTERPLYFDVAGEVTIGDLRKATLRRFPVILCRRKVKLFVMGQMLEDDFMPLFHIRGIYEGATVKLGFAVIGNFMPGQRLLEATPSPKKKSWKNEVDDFLDDLNEFDDASTVFDSDEERERHDTLTQAPKSWGILGRLGPPDNFMAMINLAKFLGDLQSACQSAPVSRLASSQSAERAKALLGDRCDPLSSNINLVRRMLIFDFEHDRHVLEVIPSKQTFYLSGLLDAGYESYTLFDATLASQFPDSVASPFRLWAIEGAPKMPDPVASQSYFMSWWLLTSPVIGTIQIPEFTCQHAVPTIEHLIPLVQPWDKNDEDALWDNKFEGPVTIGAILDFLFRDHQNSAKPVKPISLPVDEDCCMLEPETPWIDCPDQTKTDDGEPCLDAEFCTVFFDGDIQAPVKLNPIVGSTLQELLSAHEKLVGTCHVQQCVDANGQTLPLTHRLAVGELIFVKFIHPAMSALPPSVKEVDASLPATSLDPEITQTAPWTHPPDETSRKPSVFDIGECSVALIKDQPAWLNAEPLLGLQGEQFQFLSTPQISNPQQLWSVRNQFLKVQDRLAILANQGKISSDDELRFHLFALSQKYVETQVLFSKDPVKQLVTIDPLIATAWLHGKAFSCEAWGHDHGFIHAQSLPVATAFKLGNHWIPVSMYPVGDALHVFLWDADGNDHTKLNEVLEELGLAMGFVSVCIQRDRRMFFTSDLCGTLAVAYLHNVFLHVQLPANSEETLQRFHFYRGEFVKSFSHCDIARRPWVWAQGDQNQTSDPQVSLSDTVQLPVTLTREQRLDLISTHGKAVADDEIRFHILHIIDRYHAICAENNQQPAHHYLFFEPLVFTCWESIGRTISARLPDTVETLTTLHANMRATFVADLYTKTEVPATDLGAHQYTRAVDVAEMEFHLARLRAAMVPTQECSNRPIILVLQGTTEIQNSLVQFAAGQEDVMLMVALEDHHWFPLVCVRTAKVVRVSVSSSASTVVQEMVPKCPGMLVQYLAEPVSQYLCGAHAVNVIAHVIFNQPICSCTEELECLHFQLKGDFTSGGVPEELTGKIGYGPQGTLLKDLASVDVIHAEADCLWVTDLANITPGNKITQLSQIGTEDELCSAFIQVKSSSAHADLWERIAGLVHDRHFSAVATLDRAQTVIIACPGPVNLKGWKDGASVPYLTLKGFSYRRQSKAVDALPFVHSLEGIDKIAITSFR
ncbi:unnamed protein product, partial [Cladocopium goreaui]